MAMPYVGLDITDKEAVQRIIAQIESHVVIHCAAWTAVDMAEDDDKIEKVRAINADGTQNIADDCRTIDCKMLYLSTDYVFDGQGTEAWKPDCKDYKPLNIYAQTKLEGELAVSRALGKYFIVRIAWVFGLNGKNFIKCYRHGRIRSAGILKKHSCKYDRVRGIEMGQINIEKNVASYRRSLCNHSCCSR